MPDLNLSNDLDELFNLLLMIYRFTLTGEKEKALKFCELFHSKYLQFYDELRGSESAKKILTGEYEVVR